ncbi:AAA family ATPase [Mesorhizobium sp. CAU 1741]|uniref:AAA family ATPase n=1 Tax=Mesorhizobium sp. CAU 1741 TaxID=3140366 RepID=UPI00325A598A
MLVIGCSGSGKSTLSRALSGALGLPYISMDREFFWMPGWRLRERAEIRQMIAEAAAGERWIMDGTSPGTLDLRLPRADLVVWMRMPRHLCLARVLKRRLQYSGKSRPEMAEGCPERIDMEFLRYIWNFERTESPEIMQALEACNPPVPLLTLRTPAETAAVLAQLKIAV